MTGIPLRVVVEGLSGAAEVGHPPGDFAEVFAAAGEMGLRRVAHAGEDGPPEYIWQVLDVLGVERIDHGIRAAEDPAYFGGYVLDNYVALHRAFNLDTATVEQLARNSLDATFQA